MRRLLELGQRPPSVVVDGCPLDLLEAVDVDLERASIDDYRWWSVAELEATSERFYPDALVDMLRGILDR